jgi:hypothetical protein
MLAERRCYCKHCKTEFRFPDGARDDDNCPVCGNDNPDYELIGVPNYETPAQYEKRTGNIFPDDGLLWVMLVNEKYWEAIMFGAYKIKCKEWGYTYKYVVIADPPVSPPDDWKPEDKEQEEIVLCYKYDIAIGESDYPCSSCGCNPRSEIYNEDECAGCGYCKHESCAGHGCIDCNEGKCEHKKNKGNNCPDNCPKKETA